MNSINILTQDEYPELLKEIPHQPKTLYIRGVMPSDDNIFLTIVGSRKYSSYGKEITEKFIRALQGRPVVIISGLAYGIDAIAHTEAIKNGIKTIAIPGSGLNDDILYPAGNNGLAQKILEHGGALISPFPNDTPAAPWTFPARNRIMAGMSHATLVIEAEIKSGTLITSKYATEFNRNVLTVPGSIFSPQSTGPHMLIRLGATPITNETELLEALGLSVDSKPENRDYSNLSPDELKIVELLKEPMSRDALFEKVSMDTSKINSLLSLLELKGVIEEKMSELRLI